jgi:hypothetical protein
MVRIYYLQQRHIWRQEEQPSGVATMFAVGEVAEGRRT